jgi:hypothetical protein
VNEGCKGRKRLILDQRQDFTLYEMQLVPVSAVHYSGHHQDIFDGFRHF